MRSQSILSVFAALAPLPILAAPVVNPGEYFNELVSRAANVVNWRDALGSYCDLSHAQLPAAPTPLPCPNEGLKLVHVAVGRGTQNYTCDVTSPSSTPTPIGAVAVLYNFTCLAASAPTLLEQIPGIALNLPMPQGYPAYKSGNHWFLDTTTPFFSLTDAHMGCSAMMKAANVSAPEDAPKGPRGGSQYGAVAWLQLSSKDVSGIVDEFKEIYRVNTAGGSPPQTCEGMPASFEIPYAAEYWMYN